MDNNKFSDGQKSMDTSPHNNKKQQFIILSLLGILSLFCGLVYSIQGPFYPIEAQSKGISVAMIGFIYGIYELTSCLASPITGALMTRIGPVAGLHWGLVITGIGTLGLGFLGFVNDAWVFIGFSILFRIIQSFGATFRAIAVLSMATFTFPNSIATAMATIESMFGAGMCIGVIAGGALMEITGFKETFIISGSLLFIILPGSMLVLRKYNNNNNSTTDKSQIASIPESSKTSKYIVENGSNMNLNTNPPQSNKSNNIGMLTLLKIPSIALSVYALVTGAISLGFIMGVMEPHLKQFNLSPFLVGLMFLYPSLTYVIASPTLGYLYDKLASTYYVQFLAPSLLIVAFSIIGPAAFIPLAASTWLTAIGLIFLGIAISSSFVSSFLIAVNDGKTIGSKEDELHIHELISGIWRSAISLGLFVGPSLAGLLYDAIGFENESLLIIGLQIIHIIWIIVSRCKKNSSTQLSTININSVETC